MIAQDSGALVEALVRKGILTNQEAEDIRADLVRESAVIPRQTATSGRRPDQNRHRYGNGGPDRG